MEREKFKLSPEEGRAVIYNDSEELEVIIDEITENSRWSIHHMCIVKRRRDGKYFSTYYSVGATESQDERAYEYDDAEFEEVFPVTKTITVYE